MLRPAVSIALMTLFAGLVGCGSDSTPGGAATGGGGSATGAGGAGTGGAGTGGAGTGGSATGGAGGGGMGGGGAGGSAAGGSAAGGGGGAGGGGACLAALDQCADAGECCDSMACDLVGAMVHATCCYALNAPCGQETSGCCGDMMCVGDPGAEVCMACGFTGHDCSANSECCPGFVCAASTHLCESM